MEERVPEICQIGGQFDCVKQICLILHSACCREKCFMSGLWISHFTTALRECLFLKMTVLNAAKDSPPRAFCSHLLPSYWSCLCCLAGESVCVAKSQCEWPLCPRPGQSCHLCNGNHISAPLFMLSNCVFLFLPAPLLFFTPSASSYCIIGIIKPQRVEEDIWI